MSWVLYRRVGEKKKKKKQPNPDSSIQWGPKENAGGFMNLAKESSSQGGTLLLPL